MKRFLTIILILFIGITLMSSSGCEVEQTANEKEAKATKEALKEAFSQIGMPAIKNYQEKKLVKYLYELRDKADLICYAYIVTAHGQKIFLGKCIGYGVPYSAQFSAPEVYQYNGWGEPQAEPNGLFVPEGLSATWIMLINPKTGKPEPTYVENEIIVSRFPLF